MVHMQIKINSQNIFSTHSEEYQNEETNTYQYLSKVTHFDEMH